MLVDGCGWMNGWKTQSSEWNDEFEKRPLLDWTFLLISHTLSHHFFGESWQGLHVWIVPKVRNVGEKPTKFLLKVLTSEGRFLSTTNRVVEFPERMVIVS